MMIDLLLHTGFEDLFRSRVVGGNELSLLVIPAQWKPNDSH